VDNGGQACDVAGGQPQAGAACAGHLPGCGRRMPTKQPYERGGGAKLAYGAAGQPGRMGVQPTGVAGIALGRDFNNDGDTCHVHSYDQNVSRTSY